MMKHVYNRNNYNRYIMHLQTIFDIASTVQLAFIRFLLNTRVFPKNTHHPSTLKKKKKRQIATCFFFSEWNTVANKMTMASTSVSTKKLAIVFGPSDHKRYPPDSDD